MFVTLPIDDRVKNQMDRVDDFLNLINDEKWSPLVAGGAPRDWFFNKRARDIDIFLPPMDVLEVSQKLNEKYNIETVVKTSEEIDEEYRSINILGVIDFRYKTERFQIIIQSEKVNPLTHFGCSLSLITYEKFSINPTEVFLASLHASKLLFLNTTKTNYINKNVSYFPNYTVSFCNTIFRETTQRARIPRLDTWNNLV